MIETNTIVRTGMKVVTQRDELAQSIDAVALLTAMPLR